LPYERLTEARFRVWSADRQLVVVVGPDAVWAAVGDPTQNVELARCERCA
jgi:hypothetical protein